MILQRATQSEPFACRHEEEALQTRALLTCAYCAERSRKTQNRKKMNEFDEQAFRNKVDAALGQVRTILAATRDPKLADEVQHRYEDKYLLAELLTNAAVGGVLNSFDAIGLTSKGM